MKIEIYFSGGWRWRLVAANGEPLANGGEGYVRDRDVFHALTLVFRGKHLTRWSSTVKLGEAHPMLFICDDGTEIPIVKTEESFMERFRG